MKYIGNLGMWISDGDSQRVVPLWSLAIPALLREQRKKFSCCAIIMLHYQWGKIIFKTKPNQN